MHRLIHRERGWPARVPHPPRRGLSGRVGLSLRYVDTPRIHGEHSGVAEGVETIAAPWPISRMFHQFTDHRVIVHIAEFLNFLFLRPDVKVVEAARPELVFARLTWPLRLLQ